MDHDEKINPTPGNNSSFDRASDVPAEKPEEPRTIKRKEPTREIANRHLDRGR